MAGLPLLQNRNPNPNTLLLFFGILRGLLICLLILALASCMAAPAAVAPIAGGAAGPAIDKSDDLARSGKYQSFQPVPIADVISTIKQAAGELALKPVGEEKHPDQLKFTYKDDRHQEIVVTAVRRTDKETEIHVEVGMLGVSGAGQLLMRQILADLPKSTPAAVNNPATNDKDALRDSTQKSKPTVDAADSN